MKFKTRKPDIYDLQTFVTDVSESTKQKYANHFVYLAFSIAIIAIISIYFVSLYIWLSLQSCPRAPASTNKPNNFSLSAVTYKISPLQCNVGTEAGRFDCWPEFKGATPKACKARGCCWSPTPSPGVPYCYFPSNYEGYKASNIQKSTSGLTADVVRSTKSAYPDDVMLLKLEVTYETNERIHIKIYDPRSARYEVPISLHKESTSAVTSADYNVTITSDPFAISVTRKSSFEPLFDSKGMAPLIFADQYIQLGTKLSTSYIYGLGEHRGGLILDTHWSKIVFWARDQPPTLKENLYGSHPFYVNLEKSHAGAVQAHGVFLLNSNAMEVDLQPSADPGRAGLTYRTIGGVLDFYVFTGPTMDAVVQQYTSLIGKPFLPPFWALGFHLCKYGYNTAAEVKKVIERNRVANMPYDVQWNDIDYMKEHLDWTYDTKTFSELPDIVEDLHKHGQKYVIIIDPGISSTQAPGSYPPYDDGLQQDVFIKTYNGSNLVGKVWPGETVFPDFFHPKAADWWYQHANTFHNAVSFDGLWTDMNEPSNFVDGSIDGCTSNKLDNPPFVPPNLDGSILSSKTVCPSAKQFVSSHYNVHSLYGFSEARASMQALQKILGKRSLVISRSTFPGSGQYGGHWLGDNRSGWSDLYYSVPGILKFQMYGIPFVGADICGFGGDTTRELCIRWMQLGAFYPFMRNHDSLNQQDQDPASFDKEAQDMMRSALELRYSLLPFLYTLLYRSHVDGLPTVRPLIFQYTDNSDVQAIDKQFLWGSSLLISPCLEQGATAVKSFIPDDRWYDYYNGSVLINTGSYTTLDAPLNKINVHVRAGSVIVRKKPAVTTTQMRSKKFGLLVATGHDGKASGELYWDDGEILNPVETQQFTLISFNLINRLLTNTVQVSHYKPTDGFILGNLTVMGVTSKPNTVTVNKKSVNFTFNDKTAMLEVGGLNVDMLQHFIISW